MIPIPTEVTQTLDAFQGDARMIVAALTGPTTLDVLAGNDDRASLETRIARAERSLRALRLQARGMVAAEKQRLRDEARASENMAAENARILAQREHAA
jgi:hypothetical protein